MSNQEKIKSISEAFSNLTPDEQNDVFKTLLITVRKQRTDSAASFESQAKHLRKSVEDLDRIVVTTHMTTDLDVLLTHA